MVLFPSVHTKDMQTDRDLWWQNRDKAHNKSSPPVKFHSQTAETSVQLYTEHSELPIMISQTCCEQKQWSDMHNQYRNILFFSTINSHLQSRSYNSSILSLWRRNPNSITCRLQATYLATHGTFCLRLGSLHVLASAELCLPLLEKTQTLLSVVLEGEVIYNKRKADSKCILHKY